MSTDPDYSIKTLYIYVYINILLKYHDKYIKFNGLYVTQTVIYTHIKENDMKSYIWNIRNNMLVK